MRSIHPLSIGVAVFWTCCVLLAYHWRYLSATAGHLPGGWAGAGMVFGLVNAALVVVATWHLHSRLPRILLRLIQLIGMAGAFWSAGTITRAVYSLSVLHH